MTFVRIDGDGEPVPISELIRNRFKENNDETNIWKVGVKFLNEETKDKPYRTDKEAKEDVLGGIYTEEEELEEEKRRKILVGKVMNK